MDTHVVIMAGGLGTRLWPLSTAELPKQFIDLLGIGKTMLQLTAQRFESVCRPENFWVVTSERYVDIVKEQLPNIPHSQILAEPEPRNTAPCIAYACFKINMKYPKANVVVTPADAIVVRTEKFSQVISKALEAVKNADKIVTIGIKADRPETAYGYICASQMKEEELVKVESFKEKPDRQTAQHYLDAGNYYWNAGIFIWNVATILDELSRYAPKIYFIIKQISEYFYTDKEDEMLKKYFSQCDKISIDYAVMEKSKLIYVIAADLAWNDLGSWSALSSYIPSKEGSNSIVGDNVRLYDCNNCVVHADNEHSVVLEGLDSYVIAVKSGKIMICRLLQEQRIKEFAEIN